MNWRERMARFMYGRYGVDGLGRFLSGMAIVLMVVSLFVRGEHAIVKSGLYGVAFALLIWTYYRVFSKNIQKRYQENSTFCRLIQPVQKWFRKEKSHIEIRKTHHIYTCPKCKQKIKVPKGKGKVAIRCKTCGTEFIKNTGRKQQG